MVTPQLTLREKSAQATQEDQSLLDRLPREVRDEIYKLVAINLRGWSDQLEIAACRVSGLSGTSKRVREEWHAVYNTETELSMDLDWFCSKGTNAYQWLDGPGESRIRDFWTFHLYTEKCTVDISLDHDSYSVNLKSRVTSFRSWNTIGYYVVVPKDTRDEVQKGIYDVMNTWLQPDQEDGTFYMDCETLDEIMQIVQRSFASRAYVVPDEAASDVEYV